jgi:hypothetical protein
VIEYLICVLIMSLIEINENHLQTLHDMEGRPNYSFSFWETWISILIRVFGWVIPGSIILYFLLKVIYTFVILNLERFIGII